MYPLGFLFGLGFDTATEIGLLGISATQAAQGMSFWTILVFPALFTAGMSLVDTTDSVLMVGAYGWAFVKPIRKLWYNLTITAASVVVAIFIGGVEALGLIGDKLGLDGSFWGLIGDLNDDLTHFGLRRRRHLRRQLDHLDHHLSSQRLRQSTDGTSLTRGQAPAPIKTRQILESFPHSAHSLPARRAAASGRSRRRPRRTRKLPISASSGRLVSISSCHACRRPSPAA